jgi:hypothetical protein
MSQLRYPVGDSAGVGSFLPYACTWSNLVENEWTVAGTLDEVLVDVTYADRLEASVQGNQLEALRQSSSNGPTAAVSTLQSLAINLRPQTPLPDATYIRQTRSTGTPPTR